METFLLLFTLTFGIAAGLLLFFFPVSLKQGRRFSFFRILYLFAGLLFSLSSLISLSFLHLPAIQPVSVFFSCLAVVILWFNLVLSSPKKVRLLIPAAIVIIVNLLTLYMNMFSHGSFWIYFLIPVVLFGLLIPYPIIENNAGRFALPIFLAVLSCLMNAVCLNPALRHLLAINGTLLFFVYVFYIESLGIVKSLESNQIENPVIVTEAPSELNFVTVTERFHEIIQILEILKVSVSKIEIPANIEIPKWASTSIDEIAIQSDWDLNSFTKSNGDVLSYLNDMTSKGKIVSSGIVNITAVMDNAGHKLEQSSELVKDIHRILDGIESVSISIESTSEHAHVLSMNAAIESADSGDARIGFKIVSDNLRNLSTQIRSQTTEIKTVLSVLLTDLEHGIHSTADVQEFFSNMQKIIDRVFEYIVKIVNRCASLIKTLEEAESLRKEMRETLENHSSSQIRQFENEAGKKQIIEEFKNFTETVKSDYLYSGIQEAAQKIELLLLELNKKIDKPV